MGREQLEKIVNPNNRRVLARLAIVFSAGLLMFAIPGIVLYFASRAECCWYWLTYGESGSATLRNLALLVFGLIGLPFAMWRTIVAARQADIAQRTLQNARHQRAVEMFGSSELVVRLGGIYALQHLANEHSAHYHLQVMRLYCAFLRHPPGLHDFHVEQERIVTADSASRDGRDTYSRRDIEDVVRAIGTRDKTQIEIERQAGYEVVVYGADVSDLKMYDVLSYTHDANSFKLIDRRPKRRANLSRVHFRYVNFSRADLSEVDLSGATFWDPNLTDARLENADLSKTTWEGGILRGAQLSSVDLSQAHFMETSLADADLSSANLSDVNFQEIDLTNTKLRNADISGASFSFIRFKNALLNWNYGRKIGAAGDGVYVGVRGLTQAQIDEARADTSNPPHIEGVVDTSTGKPLVWQRK